jgi:uncharacterized protein (TIGR03089 family)
VATFAQILAGALRGEAGRPLVTFYDHASGERTELSVATYANWVAKTASLLAEELDLGRGSRLLVDLPTHWLGPVALGAAWTLGAQVRWPGTGEADAVLCGPDALGGYAGGAAPVVASALHPLGLRFGEPLPAGVLDLGAEVWSQPDSFLAWDPPGEDDPAVPGLTQGELWRAATAGSGLEGSGFTDGGRLLSEANPASPPGLASFTEPLARGGSAVWIRNTDAGRLPATYDAERATARWPRD